MRINVITISPTSCSYGSPDSFFALDFSDFPIDFQLFPTKNSENSEKYVPDVYQSCYTQYGLLNIIIHEFLTLTGHPNHYLNILIDGR